MPNPDTPAWAFAVAAALSVLAGAGYAVLRLAFQVAEKWLEFRRKKRQQDLEMGGDEQRSSAAEAWEVVDRLQRQIQEMEINIDTTTRRVEDERNKALDRAARCESEYRSTRRILRVIFALIKSGGGIKIPEEISAEVERALRSDPPSEDTPHH